MRNFYFNDDEYREDLDDEEFIDAEMAEMMDAEMMEWVKVDFVSLDLNFRLLKTAIRSLEKGFFWKFRSHRTKLKMIHETYKLMEILINGESEE